MHSPKELVWERGCSLIGPVLTHSTTLCSSILALAAVSSMWSTLSQQVVRNNVQTFKAYVAWLTKSRAAVSASGLRRVEESTLMLSTLTGAGLVAPLLELTLSHCDSSTTPFITWGKKQTVVSRNAGVSRRELVCQDVFGLAHR